MAKRSHKYNAVRTTVDGITFDSKGEAKHWFELQMRERAGEIRDLRRQVRFPIVVNGVKVGKYALVVDFSYREGNERILADYKGFETPMSKFKRALVKAIYGLDVQIVKAKAMTQPLTPTTAALQRRVEQARTIPYLSVQREQERLVAAVVAMLRAGE